MLLRAPRISTKAGFVNIVDAPGGLGNGGIEVCNRSAPQMRPRVQRAVLAGALRACHGGVKWKGKVSSPQTALRKQIYQIERANKLHKQTYACVREFQAHIALFPLFPVLAALSFLLLF